MAAALPLGSVRRWWWLILVGCTLGVGTALVLGRSVAPVYRATSTLFIVPPGEASLNQSFARSYAHMAVQPVVMEQVRDILVLPSSVRLEDAVTARPVPETQLVEVTAQHAQALVARDIANAVVQVFTEQQATLLPVGPAGPAVRVGQLAVTPDQPVNPQPLPTVLLGALLGVLIALAVSALLGRPPVPVPLEAAPQYREHESGEPRVTPSPEHVGRLDVVRGAIAVAIAASVLIVSFSASPVFRGSAGPLPNSQTQSAPAAISPTTAPEIAAAPAPAPSSSLGSPEPAISQPAEPNPTITDLPVGAPAAAPSPQTAPAAQGPEIAGATSAGLPVEPASPAAAPVAAEAAPTAAIPPAVLQQAPEAAPPAIAAPAGPGARVLFEDRFQDGPRLWPSDPLGPARYESTGYRLYAREAGQFVALGAPFRQPLRDALITASFTKVGGPAGGIYGLIVRDSGPEPRDGTNQIGNFYVLGVDDRGQYGVWRREGSRWVDIVPLTPSDAVRPGSATNELTALAFDDHLSLTVNGVEVATVLGTEPRPGGVGVYVAGDLNEVQLNRFEVQPATSASAPAATPVVEVAGAVDARPAEVGTVDARPADLGTLDTPAAETRPGTTRAPAGFSAAVLRAEPSTSSRALASLPNGTAIDVLPVSATGSGFTWLRVRTRVGTLGWMVSTAVAV